MKKLNFESSIVFYPEDASRYLLCSSCSHRSFFMYLLHILKILVEIYLAVIFVFW